jgi:hypothetical protein
MAAAADRTAGAVRHRNGRRAHDPARPRPADRARCRHHRPPGRHARRPPAAGRCAARRPRHRPRLGDRVVAFRDRFAGTTEPLPRDELLAFAAISAANELDIVDHADLTRDERESIRRLLGLLDDLLTDAARGDVRRTLG